MSIKNCFPVLLIVLMAASFIGAQTKPFEKSLPLQGITFSVRTPNNSSVNVVTLTTKGLARNEITKKEFMGTVVKAEVGDLNVDGSPEIYIFGISAGSGSYGQFLGLSANNKKSLTEIYMPELAEGSKEFKGYMGHDEFALVENSLVRRFPIYKPGDINAKATGGTRQIQYKLKKGEGGWILAIDKVTEY